MKKLFIAVALATCVVGCTPLQSPSDLAAKTTLDEKAAISAEVAYTTASKLGLALANAGVIDKTKFQAADNDAYQALMAVRSAYAAGNATDYATALAAANAAVASIRDLVK